VVVVGGDHLLDRGARAADCQVRDRAAPAPGTPPEQRGNARSNAMVSTATTRTTLPGTWARHQDVQRRQPPLLQAYASYDASPTLVSQAPPTRTRLLLRARAGGSIGGPDTTPKTLALSNSGAGGREPLRLSGRTYENATGPAWFSIQPASAGTGDRDVSVNSERLLTGTYSDTITVTGNEGQGSPHGGESPRPALRHSEFDRTGHAVRPPHPPPPPDQPAPPRGAS